MILVVGASGMLGSVICERLTDVGKPVRALVRECTEEAKVARLRQLGVEVVLGDLRDRSSLDAACHRISTVISTASSMPVSYDAGKNNIQTVDHEGLVNLVHAAKAASVKQFIYTSLSQHMDLDFPLRNAKREVEMQLTKSGMIYTILHPSYFMETWLTPAVGFDYDHGRAQIFGTGEKAISFISLQDVARFAVACVDNPAAHNAILELGGPEALRPAQVVRIFEEEGAGDFVIQHVPEESLWKQQQASDDPMQASFTGLMRCYAQGDRIDMNDVLEKFPVPLTSVHEFARKALSA